MLLLTHNLFKDYKSQLVLNYRLDVELARPIPKLQGDPLFGRRRRWSSEHHETDSVCVPRRRRHLSVLRGSKPGRGAPGERDRAARGRDLSEAVQGSYLKAPGTCVQDCGAGHFANGVTMTCNVGPTADCNMCSDGTCTACAPTYYLKIAAASEVECT